MQRRSVLACVASLIGAAALPAPRANAAAASWKTILDGKSLKGWTQNGKQNWEIVDGAAQSVGGAGHLVSDGTYGDFELRAEVWVSDDANSGIFIRCTNPVAVNQFNAYEVNLYDQRPDPSYGTGAIVEIAKVSPMPKAGGRWNVMEIRAKGRTLSVKLNGQVTVPPIDDPLHLHGRIALQASGGTVKFRKVQIREL